MKRQGEPDGRSLTFGTLDMYLATLFFDQFLTEMQAEPGTRFALGPFRCRSGLRVE